METPKILVDYEKCDFCGECVLSCPAEVFKAINERIIVVSGESCLNCGTCTRICPKGAISVSE